MPNRLSTTCLRWQNYFVFALHCSSQTTIKSKSPWFLLQQLSQHSFWCILNIKWGYLITVMSTPHNLIASVYGVCDINPKGEGTYLWDTSIPIRSGKHNKSSANTYAYDMHEHFKSAKVMLKPILLIEINGTQDEAPWYSKPLVVIVVLLHGVNESYLSEFNLVERNMAPLSHEITGVLLRHYSFENHLNSSCKTADCELKKNFLKTGWVPAEVWPKTGTDDCKVDAKPLPAGKMYVLRTVDASWGKKHVQQSQYSFQIIKCTNSNYCKKLKTN